MMDIQMPEMDGIEATRLIVQSGAGTRVLILTTFDLDRFVYDAMVAGASGFLLKDAGREQIVAAARIVASGDQLVAPTIARRLIEQAHGGPHHEQRLHRRCERCPHVSSRCCAWSPAACPTTRSPLSS
jgi:DNA-binding NarL/FixJ family response regulator